MKLTQEECQACNDFNEYYKHLTESKLLEGVGVVEEGETEKQLILNAVMAAVLTIIKSRDKEIDYFA